MYQYCDNALPLIQNDYLFSQMHIYLSFYFLLENVVLESDDFVVNQGKQKYK